MLIEMDADEFIEHFGTKGMRWGVRKSRSSSSTPLTKQQQATRDQRNKFLKRSAVSAGIGVAVVGALLAGHHILNLSGGSNSRQVGKIAAGNTLKKVGSTSAKGMKTPSAAALKRSAEHQAFLKQFAAKQNVINKAANLDLKGGYERGMVPFPQREYLPKWT